MTDAVLGVAVADEAAAPALVPGAEALQEVLAWLAFHDEAEFAASKQEQDRLASEAELHYRRAVHQVHLIPRPERMRLRDAMHWMDNLINSVDRVADSRK